MRRTQATRGAARDARGPLRARRAGATALALLLGAAALAGCGGGEGADAATSGGTAEAASDASPGDGSSSSPGSGSSGDGEAPGSTSGSASGTSPGSAGSVPDHAVAQPSKLTARLIGDDMLIYSQEPLPDDAVAKIRRMKGVKRVEQMSMSNVAVEDRVLTVAAVDPATYRRFTPRTTAHYLPVWKRVAGGEVAIRPKLGKRLQDEDGYLTLGNDEGAPKLHIGAYAQQSRQIDAVVNQTWAEDLGMPDGNALLIWTDLTAPQEVRPAIQELLGSKASVQILGPDLDISVQQTAILTGGSVAQAVGTFGYQVLGGGRIAPDQGWVDANIRTEEVPILGTVTCHEVMLKQLRAALTEVAARGLADKIHPDEYAGCYYPRFIAGTTSLSLHSWGIALDMNVPGNQRGSVGEFDREVVGIFKKWGFAWGGDWNYTDPMHFELARLVKAG